MILEEVLICNIKDFKAPELALQIIKSNKLPQLVNCALQKNKLLSSRASWVLAQCNLVDKKCLTPYYSKLILNLNNTQLHQGVIRNTLRLFHHQAVPIKHHSFMLNMCYNYISNFNEPIAVRAFSIGIVFNISKSYIELLNELKAVLQLLPFDEESAGMKSKIKNTLKDISIITKQ